MLTPCDLTMWYTLKIIRNFSVNYIHSSHVWGGGGGGGGGGERTAKFHVWFVQGVLGFASGFEQ